MTQRDAAPGALPPALAATVHDATNALTVVLGWIERAGSSEGDRDRALERAATHARWAREHLRTMIGGESPVRDSGPVTAAMLVERTRDDLTPEAERAGVRLVVECDEVARNRFVRSANEAWQVLTNLVLNAISMSPSGSPVVLSAAADGESHVAFAVQDNGPGIAPERRSTIFSEGTTTRAGGTGIGLRASLALAASCGAELRVAEEALPGARFVVRWPIGAPSGIQGLRLLLLEDDAAVVELLELSLGARGAHVQALSDVPALHSALVAGAHDAVLLDLSPIASFAASTEETNAEFSRLVARARSLGLAVLAISGSTTNLPDTEVLWLRKPFTPAELADAIGRARALVRSP